MYGSIIGDIAGSRFEFDRGGWTKDFEFLTEEDNWTDDSVMTIAVAEALLSAGKDATVEQIEAECIRSMQKWGRKYPYAGYGGRFIHWIHSDDPMPYGSFGNGSAMRVSAAGWLYDSVERTREVARATANVTHNHPEGIKGAECTAAVIFLARTGKTKDEIRDYVAKEFGYDLSESLDEMRKRHEHVETCMDSLPKALRSFFDGESYEDVVRNAVSLGGDTDTLAAIAGAMGEAFFDMPALLKAECRNRIEKDMLGVLESFDKAIGHDPISHEDDYNDNSKLIVAYWAFIAANDPDKRREAYFSFLNCLGQRMLENGMVPMPFEDVDNKINASVDVANVKEGDSFSTEDEVRLRMDTMQDREGNLWLPLFFNEQERSLGETANIIMPVLIEDILRVALESEDLKGVVINPFGRSFTLGKELIGTFLYDYDNWKEKAASTDEQSNDKAGDLK